MARKMMGSSVKKNSKNVVEDKKAFMARTSFVRKSTLFLAIASVVLAVALAVVIFVSGVLFSIQMDLGQILATVGYSVLLLLVFVFAAVWFFRNYNQLRNGKPVTAVAYLLFVTVCTFSIFYSVLINSFAPINFVYIIIDIIAIVTLSKVLQMINAGRAAAAKN